MDNEKDKMHSGMDDGKARVGNVLLEGSLSERMILLITFPPRIVMMMWRDKLHTLGIVAVLLALNYVVLPLAVKPVWSAKSTVSVACEAGDAAKYGCEHNAGGLPNSVKYKDIEAPLRIGYEYSYGSKQNKSAISLKLESAGPAAYDILAECKGPEHCRAVADKAAEVMVGRKAKLKAKAKKDYEANERVIRRLISLSIDADALPAASARPDPALEREKALLAETLAELKAERRILARKYVVNHPDYAIAAKAGPPDKQIPKSQKLAFYNIICQIGMIVLFFIGANDWKKRKKKKLERENEAAG